MKANFSSDAPLAWRKSSYSGSENGACVEVADGVPGLVPVRDSKVTHGPALAFLVEDWQVFISVVKEGRFTA